MKNYLLPILAFLLAQGADGEDQKVVSRQRVMSPMERELQQATDIAIVERLSAGGYRVISVLKGDRFAAIKDSASQGVTHSMVGRIRDDLRGEPQLLVWKSSDSRSPIGSATDTQLLGAAPISAAGDVSLSPGLKVSLVSLSLERFWIHLTTRGEQAEAPNRR